MPPAKDTTRAVKRIFIASPGDLSAERKRFPKILERLNKLKAHAVGIQLEPLGWEDRLPGKGRPQKLINQDVEKCDLFVMLLWKRWGTPPGQDSPYFSGTEEEYELACKLHKDGNGIPEIYLYFRQVPEEMLADPGEQLKKVLDFRKRIEGENTIFFKHYNKPKPWEEMLMEHIAGWLDGLRPMSTPPVATIPPDVEKRMSELEEEFQKLSGEHKDAQAKLREAALELGKRAGAAAKQGRLTEAEELFARATQTYPEPWVINAFGAYYMQIGSLDRSEEKFRQVEQLAKEQGSKEYLANAYGNLGIIYQIRGDLGAAEEMQRKSLALEEELGRKEGMANAYGNLGNLYLNQGDPMKAEEMELKSLALNQELGRKEGIANTYGNLGIIYKTRGDLDTAEEMHRKSLALEEELGRKDGMAKDYCNLGIIYWKRDNLAVAKRMLHRALSLSEEVGARPMIKKIRRLLAEVSPVRKSKKKRQRSRKRRR